MLLMIVKGAKNYEDIRTYNGTTYKTYKEACAARGLMMTKNGMILLMKQPTRRLQHS